MNELKDSQVLIVRSGSTKNRFEMELEFNVVYLYLNNLSSDLQFWGKKLWESE